MLDTMADYRPPADDLDAEEGGSGDGGGSGSEGEGGKRQRGGEGVGADGGEGGGKAKRRRKGGQKLSALEFEASRQLAREIAECSAEEQAAWLWQSCQRQCAASALERGGLTEAGVAALPAQGPLEERLKALEPASWQADFCGGGGGRGQPQRGQQQQGQGGHEGQGERPPGSPSLLLVSASAIGAVGLIKLCPQFHKVGGPAPAVPLWAPQPGLLCLHSPARPCL